MKPSGISARKNSRDIWPSLAMALALGALYLATLAHSPQNPDGAEMVRAAMGGGVLHSPGYPLQAWLDRVWILLPFGEPAFRLALLSASAATLGAYLLGRALRVLGLSWAAVATGVGFYALFPTVWSLAVQPEKYAVLGLLITAGFALWAHARAKPPRDRRQARNLSCIWGIVCGLALAQHPIAILFAPLMACALWEIARKNRSAWWIGIGTACGIAVGFYASLGLLSATSAHAWPDWGRVSSLRELLRLASRADFKGLQAGPAGAATTGGAGFSFLARDYWYSTGTLALLPVFGLGALARRRDWGAVLALGGTLAATFVFLARTPNFVDDLPGYTYLERFAICPVLILAILSAWSAEWLGERLPSRFKAALALLPISLVASFLALGWERADASHDRILDRFAQAAGESLPPAAVFVTGQDTDMFYGVPTADGKIRYALFGDFAWAVERVDPTLDARWNKLETSQPRGTSEFVSAACDRGLEVYSTIRTPLLACRGYLQRRGVFWSAQRKAQPELGPETIRGALPVCEQAREMRWRLPHEGHFYSRYLTEWFVFALDNAAEAMHASGDEPGAKLAAAAARAIDNGNYPDEWQTACSGLEKHLGRLQPVTR